MRSNASLFHSFRSQRRISGQSIVPFLLAMFAMAVSSGKAEEDGTKAEWKKLDGTWQLSSAVNDGKETAEDVVKKIKVVIKEGKHTVFFGDDVIAKDISFTVDLTKDPKSIEDTLPDGKTIKGIYKLHDDTLTSCVAAIGKDRPTEFAAKAGSGHTLRVFKRVKN